MITEQYEQYLLGMIEDAPPTDSVFDEDMDEEDLLVY
jgi:hypothetical protein